LIGLIRCAGEAVQIQTVVPVRPQLAQGSFYIGFIRKLRDHGMRLFFVNHTGGFPFFVLWIFHITEYKVTVRFFARLQCHFDAM
jgi:hypothetical protein